MSGFKRFLTTLCAASMLFCGGCGVSENDADTPGSITDIPTDQDFSDENILDSLGSGIIIENVSGNVCKTERNANPISPILFCADPTGIEYEGRLYVYGTSDHQQYEIKGKGNGSGYEYIKSLVVFSTDDMVNWVYHGSIPVGEIAPWIYNSWAPSIVSRVEEDGLTHFYLYFSNGGAGVGVITSTDPVTGWTDPLGEPLIYQNMPGLKNCPAPFDPGVCIDDDGVGWLAFGGGASGEDQHSFVPKIVKLGKDMLSFDSEFVSIDAPYFNEASELNYIDGVYYYTYCNDWSNHKKDWDYDYADPAPACAMCYMTTTTPLEAESWKYQDAYFYNAGENARGSSGMRWANNHTHFLEYQGTNYILHHTMLLEELSGATDGFRSLMVDYLPMDSKTQEIPITAATKSGVAQIKLLDPYIENSGTVMFTSADIEFTDHADPSSRSIADGAWVYVRGADFGYGASEFIANVKGKGRIEVRLDDLSNEAVAFIEFDNADHAKVRSADFAQFDGRYHSVYLVFSDEDIELKSWRFTKGDEPLRPEETIENTEIAYETLIISGQAVNPGPSPTAILEMTKDGDYSVRSTFFEEESEVVNLGFINTVEDAAYKVFVKSLGFETKEGIVEIPVGIELDPTSDHRNGLANSWGGAKIGSVIYGTEDNGIVAAETTVDWVNYRMALIVDGTEVPYTSITYNISVSGLVPE